MENFLYGVATNTGKGFFTAEDRRNFFLRGFNYLFIMRKDVSEHEPMEEKGKKLKGRAKKRFFERKKYLDEKKIDKGNLKLNKSVMRKLIKR